MSSAAPLNSPQPQGAPVNPPSVGAAVVSIEEARARIKQRERREYVLRRIAQLEAVIAMNDKMTGGGVGGGGAEIYNRDNREELARLRAELEGMDVPPPPVTVTPPPVPTTPDVPGGQGVVEEGDDGDGEEKPNPRHDRIGPVRVTMVNIEKKYERLARDLAEEQYERQMRELDERRGLSWVGGRFRRMILKNGRQAYIDAYIQQHLAQIKANPDAFASALARQNLGAPATAAVAPGATERARRDAEVQSVVHRFAEATRTPGSLAEQKDRYQSFLNTREQNELQEYTDADLNQLFLDYAANPAMSDVDFNARLVPVLARVRSTFAGTAASLGPDAVNPDLNRNIRDTDTYADNLLERAREFRTEVAAHAAGMGAVDVNTFRVALNVGRADDVHAHTDINEPQTRADRAVARSFGYLERQRWFRSAVELVQRSPILRKIINPTTVAIGTYCVANTVQNAMINRGARIATFGVGAAVLAPTFMLGLAAGAAGAVAGGVVQAIRRDADVKHQKAVVERRDALTLRSTPTAFEQRLEAVRLGKWNYTSNVEQPLRAALARPAWTPAEASGVLDIVASYEAKRLVNENAKVDFLRSQGTNLVESERLATSQAVMESVRRLRGMGGAALDAELAARIEARLIMLRDELQLNDQQFSRVRRAERLKSGIMGVVSGTVVSAAMGGISEIAHGFGYLKTPDQVITEGGGMTPSRIIHHEGIPGTGTGPTTTDAEIVSLLHMSGSARVHRAGWMDHFTDKFDYQELQAQWGKRFGTGIDADGTYHVEASPMAGAHAKDLITGRGVEQHAFAKSDLPELIRKGEIKYALSDIRHQGQPILIDASADGGLSIPKEQSFLRSFFREVTGKGGAKQLEVGEGKMLEVVRVVGKRPDGTFDIVPIATKRFDYGVPGKEGWDELIPGTTRPGRRVVIPGEEQWFMPPLVVDVRNDLGPKREEREPVPPPVEPPPRPPVEPPRRQREEEPRLPRQSIPETPRASME